MALPAIVLIAVFHYIPMYGIQLAFRDFVFGVGILDGDFVGMKYFKQFWQSPMFGTVIINTLRISIASILFGFIEPILLAFLINQVNNKRMKNLCRHAYIYHILFLL